MKGEKFFVLERSEGFSTGQYTTLQDLASAVDRELDHFRKFINTIVKEKKEATTSEKESPYTPPNAPSLEIDGSYPSSVGAKHWLRANYPYDPPNDNSDTILPQVIIRATLPTGLDVTDLSYTLYLLVRDNTQSRDYVITKDLYTSDILNGYVDVYLITSGIKINDNCYCDIVGLANIAGYAETDYSPTDRSFVAGTGVPPPEQPILELKKKGQKHDKYKVIFSAVKDWTEPYNGNGSGLCNYYKEVEVYVRSADGYGATPSSDIADGWNLEKTIKIRQNVKNIQQTDPIQYPKPIKFRISHENGEDLVVAVRIIDTFNQAGNFATLNSYIPLTRPGKPTFKKAKAQSSTYLKIYKVTFNTSDVLAKRLYYRELEIFTALKDKNFFDPVRVGTGTVSLTAGSRVVKGTGTNFLTGDNPEVSIGDALIFLDPTTTPTAVASADGFTYATYAVIDILDDTTLVIDAEFPTTVSGYYIWKGCPDTNPDWEEHPTKTIRISAKKKGKVRASIKLTDDDIKAGGLQFQCRVNDMMERRSPWGEEGTGHDPTPTPQGKLAWLMSKKSGTANDYRFWLVDIGAETFTSIMPSDANQAIYFNPNIKYDHTSGTLLITGARDTVETDMKIWASKDMGSNWAKQSLPNSPGSLAGIHFGIGKKGKIYLTYDDSGAYHDVVMSEDGLNWTLQKRTNVNAELGDGQGAKWVSPFNSNKIWFDATGGGTQGLWFSQDAGVTWTLNSANTYYSGVASEYEDNKLYLITSSKDLHKITNAHTLTPTITDITPIMGGVARDIWGVIEVGEGKLYACGNYYNNAFGLYFSNDDGATWQQVNLGFPVDSGIVAWQIVKSPYSNDFIAMRYGWASGAPATSCSITNNGDGTATITLASGTGWTGVTGLGAKLSDGRVYRIIGTHLSTSPYTLTVKCQGANNEYPANNPSDTVSVVGLGLAITTDGFATFKTMFPYDGSTYEDEGVFNWIYERLAWVGQISSPIPSNIHNAVYFAFTNTETDKRGIVSTRDFGQTFNTVWKNDKYLTTPPLGDLAVENLDEEQLMVLLPMDHDGIQTGDDWAKKSWNGGYDLDGSGKTIFFKEKNQFRQIQIQQTGTGAMILAKDQGTSYNRKIWKTLDRTPDRDLTSADWTICFAPQGVEAVAMSIDITNDNKVYVLGNDNNLYVSNDFGETWNSPIATGLTSSVWIINNKDYIFCVGYTGTAGQIIRRLNKSDMLTFTTLTVGSLTDTDLEHHCLTCGVETPTTLVLTIRQTNKSLWISEDSGSTWKMVDNQENFRCAIEIYGFPNIWLIGCNGKIKRLRKNYSTWVLEATEGNSGSTNRNFFVAGGRKKYYGQLNPA